jgi:hypothetical protein
MARKPASQTPVRSGLSTASMSAAPAAPAATVSSGTPVPLDAPAAKAPVRARPVTSASREYAVCDLCGGQLGRNAGHFHMVSPLTARHVSVCRTCRRAALSEGYRPRA